MAGTYTSQDALDLAKQYNHKVPQDVVAAFVCDTVNTMIWTRFPWPWTLASLTAITCVDGTQDYSISNADFFRLSVFQQPRIVRTDLTPVEYRELNVKKHLGVELTMKGGLETIRNISYEPEISKLRLDYAASVPSGTTLQIQGPYQQKPTKITSSTLTVALTQPDHYFQVFFEGVRWKLYELADDPRAGVMSIDDEQNRKYTGQLGIFMNSLADMAAAEDLSDGEDNIYPSTPLGYPKDTYWPRIFG